MSSPIITDIELPISGRPVAPMRPQGNPVNRQRPIDQTRPRGKPVRRVQFEQKTKCKRWGYIIAIATLALFSIICFIVLLTKTCECNYDLTTSKSTNIVNGNTGTGAPSSSTCTKTINGVQVEC